jgi:hypothetical protein
VVGLRDVKTGAYTGLSNVFLHMQFEIIFFDILEIYNVSVIIWGENFVPANNVGPLSFWK